MENRGATADAIKQELRRSIQDFKKLHMLGGLLIVETKDGFLFKDKRQRQFHVTIYGKEINGKPAINIHGTREDIKEKAFELNIIFSPEYLGNPFQILWAYLEIERLVGNSLEEIDLKKIKAEYLKKYILVENFGIQDLQKIAKLKKKNEGEVTEEDFVKLIGSKAISNPDEIKNKTQIVLFRKEGDSLYIEPIFAIDEKLLKIRDKCLDQVVEDIIRVALKYRLISIEPLTEDLNIEILEIPTIEDFIEEKQQNGS